MLRILYKKQFKKPQNRMWGEGGYENAENNLIRNFQIETNTFIDQEKQIKHEGEEKGWNLEIWENIAKKNQICNNKIEIL